MGVATFGGSINLFSPEVDHVRGGSELLTAGSFNTFLSVTKLNTGDIDQLNGARAGQLAGPDHRRSPQPLEAKAYNQLIRAVFPIVDSWNLTVLGTWNQTKVYTNDNTGATLLQTQLFGKNFGLSDDPKNPTYYKYNLVTKHTWFNYAKLNGDITPTLKLEDTCSYYYKNGTGNRRWTRRCRPPTSPTRRVCRSRRRRAASRR